MNKTNEKDKKLRFPINILTSSNIWYMVWVENTINKLKKQNLWHSEVAKLASFETALGQLQTVMKESIKLKE